eukprot:CAMPEP_0119340402 /NCGR_PEP_ID=MMETSP1333-20130426/100312_1 /TAXON_ID=418940 /ORGANISM="Scyphosphaera apsteinii, Strain RCC1455" /LENGTH=31 /DNA_ID= /DNA_START= /DNA_END= /DNA_ORIENTATION=
MLQQQVLSSQDTYLSPCFQQPAMALVAGSPA